jgi:hypothetical protein
VCCDTDAGARPADSEDTTNTSPNKEKHMRRIATLALTVLLATLALGAARPAAALAVAPVAFGNAYTDNYKAIWNANPEIRENRTWFQLRSVTVNGAEYLPVTLPAAGTRTYTAEQPVMAGDGRRAVVRATAGAGVRSMSFRTEGSGEWGPLVVLTDPTTLKANPARVTITVVRDGAVIGSTALDYRYEDAIYNAPRDNREYNSPGGRFWTGCNPTMLDWSAITPPSTCTAPTPPPAPEPGTAASCTISGTAGADVLIGTSGNDVICGLGGNDTIIGGPGDDTIIGGAGRDRISYRDAAAGIVINMAQLPHPAWDGPAAGDANIGWDTVTGVEIASGSRFADELHGSNGNDTLEGLGGRDVLYGYAGNDRLIGGAGNDRLYGGSGTDVLNGQAHTDLCAGGGQATDTRIKCER